MQTPHGYDFLQLAACMDAFQAAIAKPVMEECWIDGRTTLKEVG